MIEQQLADKITEGLMSNQYCSSGALISKRIFAALIKGRLQLLVMISTEGDFGDIWGHVFLKGNKWVVILTGSDGNFKGNCDEELIQDFIRNVRKRSGWRQINQIKGCKYIEFGATFDEAAAMLIGFIGKITPECYTFDKGEDSCAEYNPWRVYKICKY